MAKYHRNALGKYDCLVTGCEHRGAHGFKGAAGLGNHMKHAHKGIVATPREAQTVAELLAVRGTGFAPVNGGKVPGGELVHVPSKANGEALVIDSAAQHSRATDVVLAVLNLPEVKAIPPILLRPLMDMVVSVKELDQVGPAELAVAVQLAEPPHTPKKRGRPSLARAARGF
jgi:hypothetical protein